MIQGEINFKVIKRNSRGRRYAILVKESIDFDEIENIIKNINKIWGGYETYIIPYSNNGIDEVFIKMLKDFDPDYIIKWNEDDEIEQWIIELIENNTNPFRNGESVFSRNFINKYDKVRYPHVGIEKICTNNYVNDLESINFLKNDSCDKLMYLTLLSLIGDINFADESKSVKREFDSELYFSWIYELLINKDRLNNIIMKKVFPFDLTIDGLESWHYKNYKNNFERQN
ncbi:hypothetical protein, partial [Clostridium sp.]|uniref:hypothetical protein n=1 Tax=Clostridium sp. TaxID=1506 RepID=UPI00261E84A6